MSLKIYDERLRVQGQVVQGPKQQDEADTEPGLISEEQTRVNVLLPKFPTVRIESSGEVMGYRDPLEMTFEATASSNASPDLLSSLEYTWKFDDGAPISGKVVQHTYTRPGVNVVELTTKDKYGRSNSTHLIVAPWTCGEGEAICQQLDNTQYNPFLQPTQGNKLVHYGSATNSPPPKTPGEFSEMRGHINSVFSDLNGLTKSLPGGTPPSDPCLSFIPIFEFNSNVYSQLKSGQNVHNYQANATWTECFLLTSPKPEPNATKGSVSSQPKLSPAAMPYTPPTAGSRNFLFSAFAGLRVPQIGINIIPDAQLASDEPDRLTYVKDGITKFLMVFNVRESDITPDGRVNLDIPVYAVDEQGQWLNDLDGIFDASFADPRITSSSVDQTMINGQSEIAISVPVAQFADGASQLDLTGLSLTGNEMGCDHASGAVSATDPQSGWLALTATHEMPGGLNALAPQQLTAQAVFRYQFNPTNAAVNEAYFNRIGFGKTSQARKNFDAFLKEFESSPIGIGISVIPYVGDPADLMVQTYYTATGQPVDEVVVTLAIVGLALDITTGSVGDVTIPLKVLYKGGGAVTKEAIKGLIASVKAGRLNPTDAYVVIKGSTAFLVDLGFKEFGNSKLAIEEGLKLAREGTGSALNGLKQHNFSYNKFRGIFGANYPKKSLLNVAKYGMFAPELAKTMGKCGTECLRYVTEGVILKISNSFSEISSINTFEGKFNNFRVIFTDKASIWKSRSASALESCSLSQISPLGLRTKKQICDSLIKHIQIPTIKITSYGYLTVSGGHTKSAIINEASKVAGLDTWFNISSTKTSNGIVRVEFTPKKSGATPSKVSKTAFDDEFITDQGDKIKFDEGFVKEYVDKFFDQTPTGSTTSVVKVEVSANGKIYELKIPSKIQVNQATGEFASVFPSGRITSNRIK